MLWPSEPLPSATLVTLVPAFTSVFAPAAAFCTSPILAALVAVSPPLATLVMALLPALMPPVVTLGPLAMVKPVLSSLLSPAVMLSTVSALAVATVMSLPLRVISMLSPLIN